MTSPGFGSDRSPAVGGAVDSLQPGALVAGKYRLGARLGQGGMGLVFAAAHETLGTPMALKVLRPEAAMSEGMVGRFLQEARAAALLQSEHVARVHDFGTLDDGSPYLAMEYLHGRDLHYLLERHPRMPVEPAVEILRQTCDALSEAHAAGIVHRDLKPHNLFLLTRPNHTVFVKVLDFGIAKVLGSERYRLDVSTQSTALLGTPLYMAPEQLRAAKSADPRADIWSLGVILFQMLSGKMPFDADSLPELSVKVLTEDAPRLPASLGLPEALVDIVQRCLQRDPAQRFASVDELSQALDPFVTTRRVSIADFSPPILDPIATGPQRALDSRGAAAPGSFDTTLKASLPMIGTTNGAVSVDAGAVDGVSQAKVRGRKRLASVFAVLGVTLGGGAVFLWTSSRTPRPVTEPSAAQSTAALGVAPIAPSASVPVETSDAPAAAVSVETLPALAPTHGASRTKPTATPRASSSAEPTVRPPKVGNNGAPILEN